MLTDNGSQFTSKQWRGFMEEHSVKNKLVSKYHPQSNPVERYNREIGRHLRVYCHEEHTTWNRCVINNGSFS